MRWLWGTLCGGLDYDVLFHSGGTSRLVASTLLCRECPHQEVRPGRRLGLLVPGGVKGLCGDGLFSRGGKESPHGGHPGTQRRDSAGQPQPLGHSQARVRLPIWSPHLLHQAGSAQGQRPRGEWQPQAWSGRGGWGQGLPGQGSHVAGPALQNRPSHSPHFCLA